MAAVDIDAALLSDSTLTANAIEQDSAVGTLLGSASITALATVLKAAKAPVPPVVESTGVGLRQVPGPTLRVKNSIRRNG